MVTDPVEAAYSERATSSAAPQPEDRRARDADRRNPGLVALTPEDEARLADEPSE